MMADTVFVTFSRKLLWTRFFSFERLPPLVWVFHGRFLIMFHSLSVGNSPWRLVLRGCAIAVVAACLGLPGCCRNLNLRGENFKDNNLATQARGLRQAAATEKQKDEAPWAITNRGREIEKDLGK
jgi:hypothetical protein